jgi:hypothetical protein
LLLRRPEDENSRQVTGVIQAEPSVVSRLFT